MRTYNECFNVGADNRYDLRNRNFNYTNSNNINGYGSGSGGGGGYNSQSQNNGGSAIPYHARENSLPFSYGQIGKTSTPLKSVSNGAGASVGASGNGYGNSNDNSYLSGIHPLSSDIDYRRTTVNNDDSDTDASKIKPQPRLKSPLLVRKTLNSHSPTRGTANGGTANTISNTYHFSYGNANGNGNIGGGGAGRLSPKPLNGNSGGGGLYSNFYSTTTRQRTPPRNDFEDLLRERREKVFNEYRETTRHIEQPTSSLSQNLLQPPHQFRNEITADTTDGTYATPRHHKYNYDFEFHLNLNDDWSPQMQSAKVPPQPPLRRTSSNAMDHYSSSSSSNTFGKREQLQREQYRTRDIELPALAPRDVERNYHTLNTTTTTTTATPAYKEPQQWNNSNSYNRERFFETYEQRRQQTQSMPQPQSIQQQQRIQYSTTATAYGNGNSSGYGGYNGNSNSNNNHDSNNNTIYRNRSNMNNVTESAVYRTQLDSASKSIGTTSMPIYATTTKQVVKSTTPAAYRNEPTATQSKQTTTMTMNDYHSSVNMASPTMAVTPTTPLLSRPETPAFPVTPRTPFGTIQNGYSQQNGGRRLDYSLSQNGSQQYSSETLYHLAASPRSRQNSHFSVATSNGEPQEVAAHLVKFAKDSSKFWYKANLSRDEAISLLINAAPGTFVVRDSTTYKNAYGLVLRVAQPPPNSTATGKPDDLVRHFLIEPTPHGVRLKGCPNEPVFTSLSALVYEHSINQLALPCLLRIPEEDLVPPLIEPTPAQKQLLSQGAACNVLWLYSCDTESLTGEEAIRKAIRQMYGQKPLPTPTEVHFKVSQQGITLTDNTRKKFFRKHYASDMISFCAIDPDHRLWAMEGEGDKNSSNPNNNNNNNTTVGAMKKTIFAFVARRSPSSKDNQCHVFCDLAVNQPASAIVSFANKTLPTDRQRNYVL